jgi:prepilin-type processing-associated H-X9-DG protein
LVELLVVIGIIAVLIGILLPVISSARQQAQTTACMAAMRNLGQAIYAYAAEFKGSVPYSYYFDKNVVASGSRIVGENDGDVRDRGTFVWWSILRKFFRTGTNSNWDNSTVNSDGSRTTRFMAAFNCASGLNRDAGCDYGANMVIMPDLNWETIAMPNTPPQNQLTRPAVLSRLYPDNIILWDATELAPQFDRQFVCGYDLDGGFFGDSFDFPWYRFRGLAPTDDPEASDDQPIRPGPNVDAVPFGVPGNVGNIRWRHNRGTAANFLFADGTVRTMKMTTNYDDLSARKGEVLRKYFRPKPPPGYIAYP